MRHRAILAAGLAGVALLGTPALAQRRLAVSFSPGIAFPAGPARFTEAYRWALGGGLGLAIPLSPRFSIHAQADYNRFMLDRLGYLGEAGQVLRDLFLSGFLGVEGGEANMLTLLAGGRGYAPLFGGAVSPYGTAALGGFLLWTNAVTLTVRSDPPQPTRREGGSELSLGAALGVGVEIAQGQRTAWFVEGRWVLGFAELTPGTRTSYFPVRVGFALR